MIAGYHRSSSLAVACGILLGCSTACAAITVPILDKSGKPGLSFQVEFNFQAKPDHWIKAEIQPCGIVSVEDSSTSRSYNPEDDFRYAVTDPTSGTRVEYSYRGRDYGNYDKPLRQPFLVDWSTSSADYNIYSGRVMDKDGKPMPRHALTINDGEFSSGAWAGSPIPNDIAYFTNSDGEFRVAMKPVDSFGGNNHLTLSVHGFPDPNSYQLFPGEYANIEPQTTVTLRLSLLDEAGNPHKVLPDKDSSGEILPLKASKVKLFGYYAHEPKIFPVPNVGDGPTSVFEVRNIMAPSSISVTAFNKIYQRINLQADESSATLKSDPKQFSVTGKVVDTKGQSIAGAKVRFNDRGWWTCEPAEIYETYTDSNGRYQVKGKYGSLESQVSVEAEGFGKNVGRLTILSFIPDNLTEDDRLAGDGSGYTYPMARQATATINLKNIRWTRNDESWKHERKWAQERGRDPDLVRGEVYSEQLMLSKPNTNGRIAGSWDNSNQVLSDGILTMSVPAEVKFSITIEKPGFDPGYVLKTNEPFQVGEVRDVTELIQPVTVKSK